MMGTPAGTGAFGGGQQSPYGGRSYGDQPRAAFNNSLQSSYNSLQSLYTNTSTYPMQAPQSPNGPNQAYAPNVKNYGEDLAAALASGRMFYENIYD